MPQSRPSCRSHLKLGTRMKGEKEKKKKFQLATAIMMIQKFQLTTATMMILKCQLRRTSAVRQPNGAWTPTASSLRRFRQIIILAMSYLVVPRRRQLGGSWKGLMARTALQAFPRARVGRLLELGAQLRLR
jgi:hypothetical protein